MLDCVYGRAVRQGSLATALALANDAANAVLVSVIASSCATDRMAPWRINVAHECDLRLQLRIREVLADEVAAAARSCYDHGWSGTGHVAGYESSESTSIV